MKSFYGHYFLFIIFVLMTLLTIVVSDINTENDEDMETDIPALMEIVHAATGKKFDKMTRQETCKLTELLTFLQATTKIEDTYLQNLFIETTKSKDFEDFSKKEVQGTDLTGLMNEIISHFQENPKAGINMDKLSQSPKSVRTIDEL